MLFSIDTLSTQTYTSLNLKELFIPVQIYGLLFLWLDLFQVLRSNEQYQYVLCESNTLIIFLSLIPPT
mgnify:CR=1 FL=1